jgi:hypothetical protein
MKKRVRYFFLWVPSMRSRIAVCEIDDLPALEALIDSLSLMDHVLF